MVCFSLVAILIRADQDWLHKSVYNHQSESHTDSKVLCELFSKTSLFFFTIYLVIRSIVHENIV